MKLSDRIFKTLLVFSLIAGGAFFTYGQQIEPSFNVSLQLVIGSNEGGTRGELPANLAAVSRDLKSTFGFSSYRLGGIFLGRVANNCDFTYRGFSDIVGNETDHKTQSTLELTVKALKNGATAKGPQGFQAQMFAFQASVPIISGSLKDESGKISPLYNYERIGFTLTKIGLPENVPTLMGTVSLPGTSGTIFLIMTVKSAD